MEEPPDEENADEILDLIHKKFTGGIGKFLDVIFTCHGPNRSVPLRNRSMVQHWLQGKSTIRVVDVVKKIYDHKYSFPSSKATLRSERNHHFSPTADINSLHYARVALSSWSLRLVGNRLHKGIENLTTDPAPRFFSPCMSKLYVRCPCMSR
jgi:hypothetical protein